LLELEAVPKQVERVEPEHALYFVIRARHERFGLGQLDHPSNPPW
jgi:hypothetical protein